MLNNMRADQTFSRTKGCVTEHKTNTNICTLNYVSVNLIELYLQNVVILSLPI